MGKRCYVGVDVGGTNTVLGLFDEQMNLLEERAFRTIKPHWPNKTGNPKEFFDLLEQEIREMAAAHTTYFPELCAVGAGVPGVVDPQKGIAVGAVNLGWQQVPFTQELSRRLHVPVFIDNDVRIYTLGEASAGAGTGCDNLICLTLGTGLAAATLVNGKLVRGASLYAGEIGHEMVEGEQRLCNCGKVGCLETVASATGIAYLAEQSLLSDSANGSILHQIASERKLTSHDVYQACVQGDAAAQDVFRKVGAILGRRLVTYLFLLNPEMVIIGGGASRAGDYLLDPIRAVIRELYPPMSKGVPKVVPALLDDRAGLYGAVHFAREQLEDN